MSGLIAGVGGHEPAAMNAMFEKIAHRGPFLSGLQDTGVAALGQNYLKADCHPDAGQAEVPVAGGKEGRLRICYDGQIGNARELAESQNVGDGPFLEERVLLALYENYGTHMLSYLDDAIFTFVISDGKRMLAARDLLGIKTLFYGRKNGALYLSSELKSITQATSDVYEFPPGHCMDETGKLMRFAALPESRPEILQTDAASAIKEVRSIIRESFDNRVRFVHPTGSLLSGGIDSSVVAMLAARAHKEKYGDGSRLKTFALGVGETGDIQNARLVAAHIGSAHHERIVDLDQMVALLPEVVYHLESFDPSLVRSAVSNYMISKYARSQGVEELLSGEGGDEVFCGYLYLKDYAPEAQFSEQVRCLGFLHSNASLRLDRANAANGVRVVAPLISGKLLNYAMALPPEFKQKPDGDGRIEKWIFRKAFAADLPEKVVWRLKQEFSQGSGSADVLPAYFEDKFTDAELADAQKQFPMVRSKEELYYFRIFTGHFGSDKAVQTVGQWVSV